MRTAYASLLVGLFACTKAGPTHDNVEPPPREPAFAQPPEAKPPAPAPAAVVTVAMTAATLADDCGGIAATAPAAAPSREKRSERADETAEDSRARAAASKRACEQSSIQLSVIAPAGASASQLTVKKIELFDDKGVRIGELTPRMPMVWAQGGTYTPWDEKVTAGQELSVTYALSQPPWGEVTARWNRTYVVKAIITVGGTDRAVQRDVRVDAPAMLPPNVRT